MGIKSDEVTFSSGRSVQDLGRALQGVLARCKAASIEQIESGSAALSAFDDRADIQVIAEGASMAGLWAVQIYVLDAGTAREVSAVALGQGGFARAWGGVRNTASLGISIKKRDQIIEALR
jgi:hypothetical protein